MANYPSLVNVAWDIVNKFLKEWQSQPYRWFRERDVQVALASRLDLAYNLMGYGTLEGKYESVVEGYENTQIWSRVSCEPSIKYIYKEDDKQYICRPDIVVWDDIDDPNNPPDATGGYWPILWACEIKYDTQIEPPSSWDLKKMKYLIGEKKLRFGCWLQMKLELGVGDGIVWQKEGLEQNLWYCNAKLPKS